jgi:hypothetical protein
MKSVANLGNQPAGEPLLADEILELHAARLVLLIAICGVKKRETGLTRLDGLTKLAKLDFLTRYPEFYEKLARHLGVQSKASLHDIESSMVRFHYGPWDDRYYHILGYLESRGLLIVDKDGATFRFGLTSSGSEIANRLSQEEAFADLTTHIKQVKALVGKFTGTKLKETIYDVFGAEVVDRKLGESIS